MAVDPAEGAVAPHAAAHAGVGGAHMTALEQQQAELQRRLGRLAQAQALNMVLLEQVCARHKHELEDARAASAARGPLPTPTTGADVAHAPTPLPAPPAAAPRSSVSPRPPTPPAGYGSPTAQPAASLVDDLAAAWAEGSRSPSPHRAPPLPPAVLDVRVGGGGRHGDSASRSPHRRSPSPVAAAAVRGGAHPAGHPAAQAIAALCAEARAGTLGGHAAPPAPTSASPPRYSVPPLNAEGLSDELRGLLALKANVQREIAWYQSTIAALERAGARDPVARRQGARRLRQLAAHVARLEHTLRTLAARQQDAEYMLHVLLQSSVSLAEGPEAGGPPVDEGGGAWLEGVQGMLAAVVARNEERLDDIDTRLGILAVEEEVAQEDAAANMSPQRTRAVLARIAGKRGDLVKQKKDIVLTIASVQAQQHSHRQMAHAG